jgi:hypothetical protein
VLVGLAVIKAVCRHRLFSARRAAAHTLSGRCMIDGLGGNSLRPEAGRLHELGIANNFSLDMSSKHSR